MTFDPITRRLTPSADMWLTQATLADEDARIFSQLMFLGINDTPDNYVEWTEEEKEQWEREHPAPEPPKPENE